MTDEIGDLPVPDFQADTFSPEELELIARVLREHGVIACRLTSSHRLLVRGVQPDDLDRISFALRRFSKKPPRSGITTIQACASKACRYGVADTAEIRQLLAELTLQPPLTTKVKVGIAGCRMCCTEPLVRDIGLIAEQKGWKLTFGGNGGSRPRIGDVVADGLSSAQAVDLVRRCLTVYQRHRGQTLRTARFIEQFTFARFLNLVLSDSEPHQSGE